MSRFWYTSKGGRDFVPVASIRYLEGNGNYTYVRLDKGKHIYVARTMKSILDDLGESFIRIHKSFAVNTAFVKSMDEEEVELDNGKTLPVSRRKSVKLIKKKKEQPVKPVMPAPQPAPEQNDIANHIKSLFHYFGYGPTTPQVGGYIGFEHKVFPGNLAIYAKHSGCVCKITFCAPNTGSFVMGSQVAMPKTWTGLFTALRNHTRRLIAMRDAQYKQKAA